MKTEKAKTTTKPKKARASKAKPEKSVKSDKPNKAVA